VKYQNLNHIARHIDRLIDAHLPVKKNQFVPQNELAQLITQSFPGFYVESFGWHKTVFRHRQEDHNVVLKVGGHKSIEDDHRTYKRVPHSIRHRFFARIYWHSKYCLLQEYGEPAHVTVQQLNQLRGVMNRFGVFDLKADNLRVINGEVKIVDANVTYIRQPTLLRWTDEINDKLPKTLHLWIKKLSRRLQR